MKRILIAEDEPRIAAFVQKGLKANSFDSTVAGDGREALNQALSGVYDLVILDLGLPVMDGLEVLAELRRHEPELPVVILTARDGDDDVTAGLGKGANEYMTKPFRFADLLQEVQRILAPAPAGGARQASSSELPTSARSRVGPGLPGRVPTTSASSP